MRRALPAPGLLLIALFALHTAGASDLAAASATAAAPAAPVAPAATTSTKGSASSNKAADLPADLPPLKLTNGLHMVSDALLSGQRGLLISN